MTSRCDRFTTLRGVTNDIQPGQRPDAPEQSHALRNTFIAGVIAVIAGAAAFYFRNTLSSDFRGMRELANLFSSLGPFVALFAGAIAIVGGGRGMRRAPISIVALLLGLAGAGLGVWLFIGQLGR